MIDETNEIEKVEEILDTEAQVEEIAAETSNEIVAAVEETEAEVEATPVLVAVEAVEPVIAPEIVETLAAVAVAEVGNEEIVVEVEPEVEAAPAEVVIIKNVDLIPETTTGGEDDDEDELDIELLFNTEFDPNTAHDEFDWSITNKGGAVYTQDTTKEYLTQYESTMNAVVESEIVKGRVTSLHGGDVVLDINYKSDGLVPLSEFRDMPDLQIGDLVEVYVEQQEDLRGQLVLSRRKAKLLRAWESIVDSYENGTVIKGTVISKTKGGLIVDCSGLETFLPGSQIDIKPIIDYDSYVGKTWSSRSLRSTKPSKTPSYHTRHSSKATSPNNAKPSLPASKKVRFWKVSSRTSPTLVRSSTWAA